MSDLITPYTDNWEHLADELARLELIVQAHLLRAGVEAASDPGLEPLHGLYLSNADVKRLIEPPTEDTTLPAKSLLTQAQALGATIAARREASLKADLTLRLPLLARLFGLTEWEEHVLIICLVQEVDQRYEKFYAYLNDDLTRCGPTPHLALTLLFEQPADRAQARGLFAADGHLFHAELLRFADDVLTTSRLARLIRLDERIADFLLGADDLPGALAAFAYPVQLGAAATLPEAVRLAEAVREHLERSDSRRLLIHLNGPAGADKRALAEAVCAQLNIALLQVDLDELLSLSEPLEPLLRLAAREALLQPTALYIEGFDRLADSPFRSEKMETPTTRSEPNPLNAFARALEDFAWLTFLDGERPFAPTGRWRNHLWLRVPFTAPDESARAALWQAALTEFNIDLPPAEVDRLAGRFHFSAGQMQTALRAAGDKANLQPLHERTLTSADIARACQAQSGLALEGLAQRLEPRYGWDDIVLPRNALAQLREMCLEVRYHRRVYGEWGFGEKIAWGKGLAALFSGPSGTGKTMAAEIIAHDLELDLYRIDLSSVVSKYIGETEKNLARIFAEAERGAAVLFFDEADALFGKRSEVKDSHDRYANLEISYLLQRIETYAGVVILATNLKKNMDEAFLRRLQYVVEFPFPDTAQRTEIWRGLFPPQAPCAADVDFNFLATQLPLAGGNIKNVVLRAAFLAAADGGVINMPHLVRAAKREYDKIGRLGSESDFGPYWNLVKAA